MNLRSILSKLNFQKVIILLLFLALSTGAKARIDGADIGWEFVGSDSLKVLITYYRENTTDTTIYDTKTYTKNPCIKKKRLFLKLDSSKLAFSCGNNIYPKTQVWAHYLSKTISISDYRNGSCCALDIFISNNNYFKESHATRRGTYINARVNLCGQLKSSLKWRQPVLTKAKVDYYYNWDMGISYGDGKTSPRYGLKNPMQTESTYLQYNNRFDFERPLVFYGYPNKKLAFPKGFHLDSISGLLRFRANQAWKSSFICIEAFLPTKDSIKQYARRDFKIKTTGSLTLSQPTPRISGINGRSPISLNAFRLTSCPNTDNQCFVVVKDSFLTFNISTQLKSNIKGLKISHSNKNGIVDTLTFNWKTDTSDIGKQFFISILAKGDTCYFLSHESNTFIIQVDSIDNSHLKFTKNQVNCDEYQFNFVNNVNLTSNINWLVNDSLVLGTGNSLKHRFRKTGLHRIRPYIKGCIESVDEDSFQINHRNNITIGKTINPVFCDIDTIAFNAQINGATKPIKYDWAFDTSSFLAIDTFNFRAINKAKTKRKYSFSFKVTDSVECNASVDFDITILPTLFKNIVSDTIFCSNNKVELFLPKDSTNGYWIGSNLISNDSLVLNASDTGAYKLIYKQFNLNSCLFDSAGIVFSNYPKLNLGADFKICETKEPIELKPSPKGGNWMGSGIINNNFFSPKVAAEGKHIITYHFTNAVGCYSYDSIKAEVVNSKVQATAPDTVLACKNYGDLTLIGQPNTGIWLEDNLGNIPNELVLNSSDFEVGNHSLIFYNIDKNECFATDTTLLIIKPVPNVGFSISDTLLEIGDTLRLFKTKKETYKANYSWIITKELDTVFVDSNENSEFIMDSIGRHSIELQATFPNYGCTSVRKDSNAVLVVIPTSKQEIQTKIAVFPNPIETEFFISGVSETAAITMVDLEGRQVSIKYTSQKDGIAKVSVQTKLNSGCYLLKVSTKSGVIFHKVFVL